MRTAQHLRVLCHTIASPFHGCSTQRYRCLSRKSLTGLRIFSLNSSAIFMCVSPIIRSVRFSAVSHQKKKSTRIKKSTNNLGSQHTHLVDLHFNHLPSRFGRATVTWKHNPCHSLIPTKWVVRKYMSQDKNTSVKHAVHALWLVSGKDSLEWRYLLHGFCDLTRLIRSLP